MSFVLSLAVWLSAAAAAFPFSAANDLFLTPTHSHSSAACLNEYRSSQRKSRKRMEQELMEDAKLNRIGVVIILVGATVMRIESEAERKRKRKTERERKKQRKSRNTIAEN